MKENEDKLLEKLVDTIMKDSKLEKPSLDFTSKVMSQVLTTKSNEVYVYKPLISRLGFISIFGCFLLLFIYHFSDQKTKTDSSVNYFYIRSIYNIDLAPLFNFSKVTIYSVVLATLMLFIQISFLKKHYDNQFSK